MSNFEELHLTPAPAAALAALGWTADDGFAREVAPTVARGNNIVVVRPPTAAYAAPALAGVLSRLGKGGARGLVLCPAAELDEWGGLAQLLAHDSGVGIQAAHGTARALRRLRADSLDLLIAPLDTALALARRSALKVEDLAVLLLAWPEQYAEEDALTTLMQDFPRDAQRIIYTAATTSVNDVVERYARKALTVGAPVGDAPAPTPVGPVRTVSVSWSRRVESLTDLVELLDPASLAVWTVDRSRHAAIAQALPSGDACIQVVTGDAPAAAVIVAFDLPDRTRLEQLLRAGDVVLLVPPSAETYVARLAAPRRPLRLPGLLETVTHAASAERAAIVKALESGKPARGLLVLAPLFERYDPAAVAAALYDLWSAAASGTVPNAPVEASATATAAATAAATAKVYVGVGKKDGATANDLVAILTKDLRVDRTKIGRVELREAYSLIDVPAHDAERIAGALNGVTIRRRRVTARVDRGPAKPPGRGVAKRS